MFARVIEAVTHEIRSQHERVHRVGGDADQVARRAERVGLELRLPLDRDELERPSPSPYTRRGEFRTPGVKYFTQGERAWVLSVQREIVRSVSEA